MCQSECNLLFFNIYYFLLLSSSRCSIRRQYITISCLDNRIFSSVVYNTLAVSHYTSLLEWNAFVAQLYQLATPVSSINIILAVLIIITHLVK